MAQVKKDVSTPNKQYLDMAQEWRMIDALLGGTRAMRLAGKEYLPQYEGEDTNAYDFRLKWTYLFNFYKKAVQALVGKPFCRQLTYPEQMSPELKEIAADFDLMGNDITICTKKWFACALANGLSYGLVDYPDTGGKTLTMLQEKTKKVRPYFVHIAAKDVIGWKTISVNGVHKLSQVRFKQCFTSDDGKYGEDETEVIRVINWHPEEAEGSGRRVSWEQHEQTDKGDWVLVAEGFMTAPDEIPLVAAYTGQTGFMTAEPPLLDLAYVNVAHWQSNSDLRHMAHLLSVPVLFGTGWAKDSKPKTLQLGPDRMLTTPNPDAKLQYVEHSGKAVGFLQEYIKGLVDEMTSMAIRLLVERQAGGITATEISVDTAAAESALKSMVQSQQDALEHVVYFMLVWLNQKPKSDDKIPKFEINQDFGLMVGNDFIANWLLKANAQGVITKKTVLEGAKTLGYVKEDLDVEAELEAADEESVKAFNDMNAALGDHAPAGGRVPSDPKMKPPKNNPFGDPEGGAGDEQ